MSRRSEKNCRRNHNGLRVASRASVRVTAVLVLGALLLADTSASAASPALTFELLDAEPVSIRVSITTHPKCTFAAPIFEGLLEKGKPLTVSSDAYHFCVAQTRAPFAKVDFGQPITVAHVAGTAPLRLLVRSRSGPDGTPPIPRLWMAPLVLSNIGSDKIGVRVAAGTTGPCMATGNTPLFTGVLTPFVEQTVITDAPCVCFEQTYAPFLSAGWSPPTIRCRPMACIGKSCTMNVNAPFLIALQSAP